MEAVKFEKLGDIKVLYLSHPEGLSDKEVAEKFDISREQANRYRRKLGARQIRHGIYTLDPTKEDIAYAKLILSRVANP